MSFKGFREHSHANWGLNQGLKPTDEQIKIGAILRMADAMEKAARQLDLIDVRLSRIQQRLSRARALNQRKPAKNRGGK